MARGNNYLKSLLDNQDIIAGLFALILGTFIIYLYFAINLNQWDIGFVIISASFIYLVNRNKFKKPSFELPKISKRSKLLLNIIFFIVFLISLFVYLLQPHYRPISYFILVAFLAGLIAIETLYSKDGDSIVPIIFKIFLLSINIRAGIYYNFPSILGYDMYWHAGIVEVITNTGFVPPFEISNKYYYYPLAHIFISMAQILYEINIKNAIFFSIALASVFSTIFIYYIGKRIAGPKVGLLGILLINITSFSIVRGIANVTPGSLVLCYFMFILYLMFETKNKFLNTALMASITYLIIITHQLTTFVVFISVTAIYIGMSLRKILHLHKGNSNINSNYVLLFATAIIAYWMTTYARPDVSFFEVVLRPLIDVVQSSGGEYGSDVLIVGYDYKKPLLETLILHTSYLILPFFAIGGVLFWLSPVKSTKQFSIAVATILLCVLAYGIPLLGIRNLLTNRWMPIVSIFLAIAASEYIFKITYLFKRNYNKTFVIFTIIIIFSFFMIVTPAINKDDPIVSKDTTVRNQFKDCEIYSAKTIFNMYPEQIIIDLSFANCFQFYGSGILHDNRPDYSYFDDEYIKSNQIEATDSMIVLRKSTLNEPISIPYSELYGLKKAEKLPKEFFEKFESVRYNLVYSNEEILGYRSKS